MSVPGYWAHETSGILRGVVERYLHSEPLSPEDIAMMRAYVRQWVACPMFRGSEVDRLRDQVDYIVDRESLTEWLERAIDAGVDPL